MTDRLEQALAAPFQSARERYANNTIALRARQEILDGLRLDDCATALRTTHAAWLKALERGDYRSDTFGALGAAIDSSQAACAALTREISIVDHVLNTLSAEHAAAVRASDSPASTRTHALIARARKLRGVLCTAVDAQRAARRV